MKEQNKILYAPNLRNYLDEGVEIRDPIVSNNIASEEFDYTYDEEDDLILDEEW